MYILHFFLNHAAVNGATRWCNANDQLMKAFYEYTYAVCGEIELPRENSQHHY